MEANASVSIQRVLVGYDGSEQGMDALRLGAAVAAAEQAELFVAVVYEPESVFDGGDHSMPPIDEEKLRAKQDAEMRERFAEVEIALEGRSYERRELWGSPARELTALAEAADTDLVVVGSTHEGKLGRVLPGSVGERLLHGAPCAVAVAPHGFARREHFGIGVIGVGYTGAEESRLALDWAAALARQLGARLRLIAAVREFNPSHRPGLMSGADYQRVIRENLERQLAEATEAIEDVDIEQLVLDGDPTETLARQGIELDLLVVGSRGYGPLRRVLLGGVSGRLIQIAPCPVVVTPRGTAREATDVNQPPFVAPSF